jgi:hypothetical protein
MVDLVHLGAHRATADAAVAAWADSGAMMLTGRHDGPPLTSGAGAAAVMAALATRLQTVTRALGVAVELDGPALLGERAALTGHHRQGPVSVGGATRLLAAADGWLALTLARDSDHEALAAWLEADQAVVDAETLARMVARRSLAELVERAGWLGLGVGALGESRAARVPARVLADAAPVAQLAGLVVVDLSSLWAGPLCSQLLARAGATVIKVESISRPDGARRGPPALFDLLHAGKASVALELASEAGRQRLGELLACADVVIEGSRPRALAQLGIDAMATTAKVWLSITGHGRTQPHRVGFGDDAAVAGGLVARDVHGPVFAGDAIADPLAGLFAAVAVLDRLVAPGRWLIDVGLSQVAAMASALETSSVPTPARVAPPRARPVVGVARPLGSDTDEIWESVVGGRRAQR